MQKNKKNWRITFLLIAMTLIGVFPIDVLLPSFPALSAYFDTPLEGLSLSISVFAIGIALSQLLIGPLSDFAGRKNLLMGGLLVAAVGAIGAIQAESFPAFVAWRLVQALGCGCFVLVNAIIQDTYSADARDKIRIVTTTSAGIFISLAPFAGVVLQSALDWTASFWVFAGFTTATIALCVYWLPDHATASASASASTERNHSQSPASMLGNSAFAGYSALSAVGFACHFSFIVLSPVLLLEELSLTQYQYAAILLYYGIAYLAGGMIAWAMHRRLGRALQLRLGIATIMVSGLLLTLMSVISSVSAAALITCMILCTCGVSILRPIATTKALEVFPNRAGTASSILNTLVFLTGAAASTLLAIIPMATTTKLGGALLMLSAAGLLVCVGLQKSAANA